MEVHIQGVSENKRRSTEVLVRHIVLGVCKEPTGITFTHTDALTNEVDVSVPKLNGELKIAPTDFLTLVGNTVCRITKSRPISCRMRGTANSWRRL